MDGWMDGWKQASIMSVSTHSMTGHLFCAQITHSVSGSTQIRRSGVE
jgi:hypothetical protein